MGATRELPLALRRSEDFKALTEKEVDGFQSRLRLIEESLQEMELWLSKVETDGRDLRNLIDDVELDLSVSQSVPEKGQGVSNWLVHTSWTFEHANSCLSQELAPNVRKGVDRNPPQLGCGEAEFVQWLQGHCSLLRETIEEFYAASSTPSAVAHLIAINSMVSAMLLAFYRARL